MDEELQKFILCLENSQSPDNALNKEATEAILEFRDTNLDIFLSFLTRVLSDNNCSKTARSMALILLYQTLENIKSDDQKLTQEQFVIKKYDELIKVIVENCTTLMMSDSGPYAASLYALISMMYISVDNYDLLGFLTDNTKMSDPFLANSLSAILQISQNYYLEIDGCQKILNFVFQVLKEQDVSHKNKENCLSIISQLICSMVEWLSNNEDSLGVLVNVIFQALEINELKVPGYDCIYELVKYLYKEAFLKIYEQIVKAMYNDLWCNGSNDNLCISIFLLLQKIVVQEKTIELDGRSISELIFNNFFQLIVKFALNHDQDDNFLETNLPSNIAMEILCSFGSLMPNTSIQTYFEYAMEHLKSENPQEIELSFHLLAAVVENI